MTMNEKKKREYAKPAMRVFELQGRRSVILCGSPGAAMDVTYEEEDF